MTSTARRAFSIFSLRSLARRDGARDRVSFLVSSPSPRIFTHFDERGHHARRAQRRRVDGRAGGEALLERAEVDRERLLAEGVLEAALREAPLHRHLAALEAQARAVVAAAGLLALDALTRGLAVAGALAAADALLALVARALGSGSD